MPLIINEVQREKDKVITMGKQPEADYYPPGATEPIVRPSNIPSPAVPIADVKEKSIKEAATSPPVAETVKEEGKKTPAKKK